MKTIVHIVGNRPQFIKLAVLYNELAKDEQLQQKIIHTGQHYSYQMSELFFKELHIPVPDLNLDIQHASPHLFIGTVANKLSTYFSEQKNSVVMMYGDTNTTLAAAMAARSSALPLLHFEAGVRTNDNSMPEETNRVLTDRLADVNYCCTENNFATMQQEGFGSTIKNEVVLTGDLMLDAFLQIGASPNSQVQEKEYVVCTIHREANLSSPIKLGNIVNALNKLHQCIAVVMPLHPHTKKKLELYGLIPAFITLPPLGYPDMKNLLSGAAYIITDSGGTSREAYFLQKKSLVIMDHPFWPEIISAGCAVSSPAEEALILENFNQLPALSADFSGKIFGNGRAAANIHQHLSNYLQ